MISNYTYKENKFSNIYFRYILGHFVFGDGFILYYKLN